MLTSYLLKRQTQTFPQMQILDDPILRKFLSSHSNHTTNRPLAVFDCDGTIIRGDIGEAMLYYQIEHFCFRLSPASIWQDHPQRTDLENHYRALADSRPESRTSHRSYEPFARLILSWYFGQIGEGKVAKACADIVRLFAGYSPEDVRRIAQETFESERNAPLAERGLGGYARPSGVRYFRESVEVLRKLLQIGFDLRVVSGSNRWSVESVFEGLGVARDRIVGIDLRLDGHVFSSDAVPPIPVQENKIAALKEVETRAPLIVASDSLNDLPLFRYSSQLKLYINSRRKSSAEFFTRAGLQPDESWVIVEHPTLEE